MIEGENVKTKNWKLNYIPRVKFQATANISYWQCFKVFLIHIEMNVNHRLQNKRQSGFNISRDAASTPNIFPLTPKIVNELYTDK